MTDHQPSNAPTPSEDTRQIDRLVDGELSAADWVVVNTCAVTRRGEDKARQWVRKVAREVPEAQIAVVGCSVEVSAGRFRDLAGVKLLLGTEEKFRLGEVIADFVARTGARSSFTTMCRTGLPHYIGD